MSCFPDARPTRRERFRRWSERERNRWWRRFHPRQAAQYDAAQRAMWAKIAPSLTAASKSLFAPDDKLREQYFWPIPKTGLDWYVDVKNFPRLTLRQRAVNAFWRLVEALP